MQTPSPEQLAYGEISMMSVPQCWLDAVTNSPPTLRSQQQRSTRVKELEDETDLSLKGSNTPTCISSSNTPTPRASPTLHHAAHYHHCQRQDVPQPATQLKSLNNHITTIRAGRPSPLRPIGHYYFESNKEADGLEGNAYEELRVNPFASETLDTSCRDDHGLVYEGPPGHVVWQAPQVCVPAIGEIRMDVFGRSMPYQVGSKSWKGKPEIMTAPIRQRMTAWYTHPELVAEARYQALVSPEQANDDSSIAERQRQADILRHTKPTGTEADFKMRQLVFTDNKWTMAQVFEDLQHSQEQAWRQYYADVMRTFRPIDRPRIDLSQPTYDPVSFDDQFNLVDHMRYVNELEQPTAIDYSRYPSYHFYAGVEAAELSRRIFLRDEPPKETARNAAARVKQVDAKYVPAGPTVRATAAPFRPSQQTGVPRVCGIVGENRAERTELSKRHDSAVQLTGRDRAPNQPKSEMRQSIGSRAQRPTEVGHLSRRDNHKPRYAGAERYRGQSGLPSSHHASSSPHEVMAPRTFISMRA